MDWEPVLRAHVNDLSAPHKGLIFSFDLLKDRIVHDFDERQEDMRALSQEMSYIQILKWHHPKGRGRVIVYASILKAVGKGKKEYQRIGRADMVEANGISELGWNKKTVVIV